MYRHLNNDVRINICRSLKNALEFLSCYIIYKSILQQAAESDVYDPIRDCEQTNTTSDIRIGIPFTYSLTNQWI